MTPNLTRLFEYKKLDGLKRELAYCGTYVQRKELFDTHGEALIDALELARRALRVGDVDALPIIEQLLAQLEREAQP